MLCLDKRALKVGKDLQKNVLIEDLLLNHSHFFDSKECAEKEGYVPITLGVSIRTVVSNRVLKKDGEVIFKKVIEKEREHKGYDLIMFEIGKYLSESLFKEIPNDLIMRESFFQLMCLYYYPVKTNEVLIYAHIIVGDNLFNSLKGDYVEIKDLELEQPFLSSFIEIKVDENVR